MGGAATLPSWGGARMRDRTLCGEMARILAHWPARESRAWPEARDRRRRPVNCERGARPRAGVWRNAGRVPRGEHDCGGGPVGAHRTLSAAEGTFVAVVA